jgi:hypothetical protein
VTLIAFNVAPKITGMSSEGPITVLSIINESLKLTLKTTTVLKELHGIAWNHNYAQSWGLPQIADCVELQTAWSTLEYLAQQNWAQRQSAVQSKLLEQLKQLLAMGNAVITEYGDYMSNWSRSKIVRNDTKFLRHRFRTQGVMITNTIHLTRITIL